MPDLAELPAVDLLGQPLLAIMNDPRVRAVLDAEIPAAAHTELVALPTRMSLIDLARSALIPARALRAVAYRPHEIRRAD